MGKLKKERRGEYRSPVSNAEVEETNPISDMNIDEATDYLDTLSFEEAVEATKEDERAGITKYMEKRAKKEE